MILFFFAFFAVLFSSLLSNAISILRFLLLRFLSRFDPSDSSPFGDSSSSLSSPFAEYDAPSPTSFPFGGYGGVVSSSASPVSGSSELFTLGDTEDSSIALTSWFIMFFPINASCNCLPSFFAPMSSPSSHFSATESSIFLLSLSSSSSRFFFFFSFRIFLPSAFCSFVRNSDPRASGSLFTFASSSISPLSVGIISFAVPLSCFSCGNLFLGDDLPWCLVPPPIGN